MHGHISVDGSKLMLIAVFAVTVAILVLILITIIVVYSCLRCGGYVGELDGKVMMVKWSHFESCDTKVEL